MTHLVVGSLVKAVVPLMATDAGVRAALQPILDAADWPLSRDAKPDSDAQRIIAYLEGALAAEQKALEERSTIGSITGQRAERLRNQRTELQIRISYLKRLLEDIQRL